MIGYLSLGLLCAAMSAACYADDGGPCGRNGPPAVAVNVREAGTDRNLAAGAHGAIQAGSRIDSLSPGRSALFPDSVLLGGVRDGIYEVRVEHPGYQPWVQADVAVQVTGYPCPELETQGLTALLQVGN